MALGFSTVPRGKARIRVMISATQPRRSRSGVGGLRSRRTRSEGHLSLPLEAPPAGACSRAKNRMRLLIHSRIQPPASSGGAAESGAPDSPALDRLRIVMPWAEPGHHFQPDVMEEG